MSRMKFLLASLLAMLAMGSVAADIASATELQGPWWRHPELEKQVKYPQNKTRQIKGINSGGFEVRTFNVSIFCGEALVDGAIWNGAHQGQDQAKWQLLKCRFQRPVICAPLQVKIAQAKVYTELMWKYQGAPKELTEAGGQQKIYDVFAPTTQPNKLGLAPLTTIGVPPACFPTGQLNLWAAGSISQFQNAQQVSQPVVWATAAEVEPQNQDSQALLTKWVYPNVELLHHQEKPVEAELLLEVEPNVFEVADIIGGLRIERQQGQEEFGAFNQ
jgi:hypothetical protein